MVVLCGTLDFCIDRPNEFYILVGEGNEIDSRYLTICLQILSARLHGKAVHSKRTKNNNILHAACTQKSTTIG
jgi:hypothetical protein